MIPSETFHDYYFISSTRPKKRRKLIIEISGNPNPREASRLNELILWEIRTILKKRGQKCNALPSKGRKFKIGKCYSNAVQMMKRGFGYVEGFVIDKQTGKYLAHAWNVDNNGNHFDFTFNDPHNYEYFGILIPEKVVWEVGAKNGNIWYAVLPFVDTDFNYKD